MKSNSDNDVEMGGIDWGTHAPVPQAEPTDQGKRKTVLETRTAEQVAEELTGSPKRLKSLKFAELSLGSELTKSESADSSLNDPFTDSVAAPDSPATAPEDEDDEEVLAMFSGDEEEEDKIPAEPTESQEKTRDREILKSFLKNRQLHQQKEPRKVDPNLENRQSVRWLANNTGAGEIVSSAREYQIELFERAKEDNIIAVLDTGSGKTLIAVLLLQHIISEELERRAQGAAKKISFFLVDSVALVFQQAAVLKCNLNQKVEQFCGEMGCDLWSKEHWRKHFEENMVIVVTAEVLNQCLHHSFINMSEINLLIFDEAHHAKKNHPYSRIIKDFYLEEKEDKNRPKIFGMTASPVDAKTDVQKAAMELETLLHCKIATSSDESIMQYVKDKRTTEIVAEYDPLPSSFQTPLFTQIFEKIGNITPCKKPLVYAKKCSSELGAWAADQVFANSFSPGEVKKLRATVETKFHKWCQKEAIPISRLNMELAALDEVAEIVANHDFKAPENEPYFLSSKVRSLLIFLHSRYERTTDDKCIVFVKERYTAKLLADLIARPEVGTDHLRVGSLVGTAKGSGVTDDATFRSQMLTLRRFRNGELNCLIATSVAEEGLDVPDCNLIVRFDLCQTVIQYIQSRGRARLANSQYLHLVEKGNDTHHAMLTKVQTDAEILKKFCKLVPEDRVLTGNSNNLDYYLAAERATLRTFTDPITKAKLTYPMSLSTLGNYVASLEHTSEGPVNPEYIMTHQADKFRCEVILPENSPVQGCVGRPERSKQIAKCSAAFETCIMLRKTGLIDAHFVSTQKRTGPAMRNARLAVGAKNNEEYDMKTKPNLWNPDLGWKELYLTVIYLTDPKQMGRSSQPIGLLTRGQMPNIPSFDLFFGKTETSPIYCTTIGGALPLDTEEKLTACLDAFNTFTLRIFHDVFSKEYGSDISKMPYFFCPIREDFEDTLSKPALDDDELLDLISWDILDVVREHKQLGWEGQPDKFFEDRYMYDVYDGSRKLWTKNVTHELKATDPPPPDTFVRHHRHNQDNIIEYSCSLFKKSRLLRKFSEDQPVIEAELIPVRRNLLDDRSFYMDDAHQILKCFVVPEPLCISALPTKIIAMAYCLPAVIHKVESYLIALDACAILSLPLDPMLALESVTKDSQNTEEHGKEQIHFQRGMGKNYERLEFLGDCFLKMATSIALFTRYPDAKELDFHVKRMLMICNKNLTIVAEKLKLHEYIRTAGFTRRAWYPEGLTLLKGNTKLAKKTHILGSKTIADVSEALIGASFLTPGEDHIWDTAVRAVAELVCSDDHTEQKWIEYGLNYKKPKYQTAVATASQIDLAKQVEAIDNYHFKHPRLLRSAFIHPTYPFLYERVPNYQRLEFLGDSLLDMVCVQYLFGLYPDKDPQWLTEHKMAMASNQFLGALCVELGFQKHLLHMGNIIPISIADYIDELAEAKELAVNEALRAGKTAVDYSRDFWNHCKKPPKFLADMIESYIGAIFVDSGFDFAQVQRFFDEHIRWYFEDVGLYDTYANNHPVTALSKFVEQQMGCARYNISANQHPDDGDGLPPQVTAAVMIHSQIICAETRESVRYAKSAVAKTARDIFRGISPDEFRKRWGCDCKRKGALDEDVVAEVDEKVVADIVREEIKGKWELTSSEDTEGSRRPRVAFA